MDQWEVIYHLFDLKPHFNAQLSRYVCKVCGKKLKTERGIFKHIKEDHQIEINELRDRKILDTIK